MFEDKERKAAIQRITAPTETDISDFGKKKGDSSKPPKYVMYNGYLYKRVPNKEIKESLDKYKDLSEMVNTMSNGRNLFNN